MSKPLVNIARLSLVFAVAGLVVSGCGRKGDLDRPSTPVEQQNIRKSGKPGDRKPEPVIDRPFLLDPLL
jgi:predicted small lipoprotein YifL